MILERTLRSWVSALRVHDGDSLLRRAARTAIDAAIVIELAVVRLLDLARPRPDELDPMQVTIVVKTFERRREVRRLVRSIRRLHPDVRILVVDDSRGELDLDGAAEVITLPFNSGVSKGRRVAFEAVTTPYTFTMDDDFVVTRRTDLAAALTTIREHDEIDILGGAVTNLPELRTPPYVSVPLFEGADEPLLPPGWTYAGLPVRNKVPNFFLCRTEPVLAVGWSDELKFFDHADFFSRASGHLLTVQDESLRVFHARNPLDRGSPERVANANESMELLRRRWSGGSAAPGHNS